MSQQQLLTIWKINVQNRMNDISIRALHDFLFGIAKLLYAKDYEFYCCCTCYSENLLVETFTHTHTAFENLMNFCTESIK